MPTPDGYEPGTPCWIDLMSPDVDASKDFYTQLFGWDAEDQFDDEGTRIYTNFLRLDGRDVAGLGGQTPEAASAPPVWSTHIATSDVDETSRKVEAAGGTVMMPAMDVMDAGRMAIYSDPTGAVVSVWEAGRHTGAGVCNEPRTWSWNELLTRDVDAAAAFYADVFGWTYQDMEMPFGIYRVIQGGDFGGRGGMMPMPPGMPDMVPQPLVGLLHGGRRRRHHRACRPARWTGGPGSGRCPGRRAHRYAARPDGRQLHDPRAGRTRGRVTRRPPPSPTAAAIR
jgi:predicted enzyme related to lactoylglutathione lyase